MKVTYIVEAEVVDADKVPVLDEIPNRLNEILGARSTKVTMLLGTPLVVDPEQRLVIL